MSKQAKQVTVSGSNTVADFLNQSVKAGASPTFNGLNISGIVSGDVDQTHIPARKASGGTIPKGRPIYVVSYNPSGYLEVEEADASDSAKMPAIAVTEIALDNTSTEFVAMSGRLTGLDTDTPPYAVGSDLYVASGTGVMVTTAPTGTNFIQKMAEVVRVHLSAGVIMIYGAGRQNALPNLAQDKIWVGNASGVPVEGDPSGASPSSVLFPVIDQTGRVEMVVDPPIGDGLYRVIGLVDQSSVVGYDSDGMFLRQSTPNSWYAINSGQVRLFTDAKQSREINSRSQMRFRLETKADIRLWITLGAGNSPDILRSATPGATFSHPYAGLRYDDSVDTFFMFGVGKASADTIVASSVTPVAGTVYVADVDFSGQGITIRILNGTTGAVLDSHTFDTGADNVPPLTTEMTLQAWFETLLEVSSFIKIYWYGMGGANRPS